MTDEQDIIHQIEYRWHDRRDLSPIASTMPPDSLRGWDSWIRTWVRHPHVEGLRESMCYQVQPNGRAALAWRYENSQAAERADGTRGRPLVSRVLTGQASQLTPEVAIVLCRTGLPETAGPPPGAVTADSGLPAIAAGDLTELARAQADGLDEEAAGQCDCLLPIVAAALSDPHTPLAVHLRDSDIVEPPGTGLQCPLLWGLWRTVRPVLGTGGRGWSFSTFELPLGDVDPATMPDILFRQTRYTSVPPARPRRELKLRPFEPGPPDEKNDFAELAAWLLAEFKEQGGDGLRQLIEGWQGADKTVQPRLSRIYEELRAKWSPAVAVESAEPEPEPEPAEVQEAAESWVAPASRDAVEAEEAPAPGDALEAVETIEPDEVLEIAEADEILVAPEGPALPSAGRYRAADRPEPSDFTDLHEEPWSDTGRVARSRSRALAVSELLKRLPDAESSAKFYDIIRDILDERTLSDLNDRVKSRREVSKPEWYLKISVISNTALIDVLAAIFGVIVIPDLNLPDVVSKITEWSEEAQPPVIGGLLEAAKQSGESNWRLMMQVLEQRLAYRWMLENDLSEWWYSIASQQGSEPGRGRFGFFKKN